MTNRKKSQRRLRRHATCSQWSTHHRRLCYEPLEQRFLLATVTVALQDGLNGYQGTRDTSIRGDFVTTNYGSRSKMELDGNPDQVSFIRWDTATIPTSSTVTDVALRFNVVTTSSDTFEIYEALRSWDELTATYQLAASGEFWGVMGAAGATDRGSDVLATITGPSLGLVTVPLNALGVAMVQKWITDPLSNRGIVIQDLTNATTDDLDLSSSEASSVSLRPQLTITYDTTPPAPLVAVDTLLTNDPTPPLSGTVSNPSAAISVTVDGQTKDAVNHGDGTWTLANDELSILPQGNYDVAVTATASGNSGSDVTTGELTIDTTPPTSTFALPVDCQTYNVASWTDSITGTAADTGGGGVAQVQLNIERLSDNRFWSGTAFDVDSAVWLNASGTSGWSFPFEDSPLTDGDYRVSVRVTDTAGNADASTTAKFTYDTTPPPAPVVTVDALLTNDPTPPLSGTVSNAGAAISVTVNGQTEGAVNHGDGTWTLADNQLAALPQGVYDVAVTATAGTVGGDATTNELKVDTSAPVTTLSFPVQGASYRSSGWADSILGTAVDVGEADLDSVRVSIRRLSDNRYWSGAAWDQTSEFPLLATGTTNWSYSLPDANLTDGVSYTVTAQASDTAGNIETKKTASFTLDDTRPVLNSFTRQTPTSSPTNANTLIFRATFNESVADVSAGDFAVTGTSATVTDVDAINASTYDVTVSGGDLAGLNGTVGLNLASGQDITDLAGNTLPGTEPATDQTYVVDNTIVSVPIVVALQDGWNGYQGTRDTSIRGDMITTNFGTKSKMELDGSPDQISLIRWEMTGIPSSSTVTAASLTVNVINTSIDTFEVYQGLRAWDEKTATYQLAATGQSWGTPGASGPTDHGPDVLGALTGPSTGLITIQLNVLGVAMVQSWVSNPATNHGIIIQDLNNASTDDLDLSSREQSGLGPKLTITYSQGPPPPPPPPADPVAVNDSISTTKNTSGSVNVLANDSDPNGDAITVSGHTQPSHGSLGQNSGTFTYTPASNYTGADSFSYTIQDSTGRTATASVSIQVSDQAGPIVFRAMGDVPYSSGEYSSLASDLANVGSKDLFFAHLGDIKAGSASCTSSVYSGVADVLLDSQKTVFIIPGDNEWNDCSNPTQAWGYWTNNFGRFDENWTDPFTVRRQSQRDENFAFVHSGVLFIGINLVGGKVHDSQEWARRMTDNSQWVSDNLATYKDQVSSAVVLAHAFPDGARQSFGNAFVTAAQQFEKPVLYLMGDKHSWKLDQPFSGAPNVTRVIVDQGVPSVRVTVTHNPASPFEFDRTP